MTILIIEDNEIKYQLVENHLRDIDSEIRITRAVSYNSGVEALVQSSFDWVILDMTLPAYDAHHSLVGMDVFTFGGGLILRETKRRRIKANVIILTQYDTFVRNEKEVTFEELRVELIKNYAGIVRGCVRLDSTSVSWKNELTILIQSK